MGYSPWGYKGWTRLSRLDHQHHHILSKVSINYSTVLICYPIGLNFYGKFPEFENTDN